MRNIFETSKIVKRVLTANPATRNSDDELYLAVIREINPVALSFSIVDVLNNRNKLGIPPFESVRRSRQKLQESCPELRASNETVVERAINETIVKAYSLAK